MIIISIKSKDAKKINKPNPAKRLFMHQVLQVNLASGIQKLAKKVTSQVQSKNPRILEKSQ